MSKLLELSIISPVYQAEDVVSLLVNRIISSLKNFDYSYEILLIDDCSCDNSWSIIKEICLKHSNVIGIKLNKNYGQQYAIQTGFVYSKGKYIVTLDCDLQDRPEEILKLYKKIKNGYGVVVANRLHRQDPLYKIFLSKIFSAILRFGFGFNLTDPVVNFAIYNNRIVKKMLSYDISLFPYYPIMRQLIHTNMAQIEVIHSERFGKNKSSYSILSRIILAHRALLVLSKKRKIGKIIDRTDVVDRIEQVVNL